MPAPTQRQSGGRRRVVFRIAAIVLLAATAAGTGPALVVGPALAAPAPTPAPGVPDPGIRPSPDPVPPTPDVPSPIPAPPTDTPIPAPDLTPNPEPDPQPGPAPPPAPVDDAEPSFFDIPGQIRKALNDFFAWVARTGLSPVLDTLGATVLATPDLTGNARISAMWTASLVIANGIFVLFIGCIFLKGVILL